MRVSLSLAHLRTCYVSLLLDTVIFASHLEGKDQIGFCICLSVVSYALLPVCFLMKGVFRLTIISRAKSSFFQDIGIIGLTEFCV